MVAYMSDTEQEGRILTVKEIAKEYGLNEFSVSRILRRNEVANVFQYSRRTGYRVPEKDWRDYWFKKGRKTGPVVDGASDADAQK